MDAQNFVAPSGGGNYVTYVGGQQVFSGNQASAQNAYNTQHGADPVSVANASGGSSTGGTPGTQPGTDYSGMQALAQMASALNQAQLDEKIREFNQTFGLDVGQTMGSYNNKPTEAALNQAGYTIGPGNTTDPTLAALQQLAGLTGMVPTGMPGAAPGQVGTPTIGTQALTGYLTLPGQGQVATTAEQGIQLQAQQNALSAINNILSANTSPANPFTYLSKLQGISNLGPTAGILRGALGNATGQSISQLQQQPTVLNNQLMSNLYGQYLNNPGQPQNNTLGTVAGLATSNLAPQPGMALPGAGSGHIPGAPVDTMSTANAATTPPPGQGGATAAMGGGPAWMSPGSTPNILGQIMSMATQNQQQPLKPGQIDTNSLLHALVGALATSSPASGQSLPSGPALSTPQQPVQSAPYVPLMRGGGPSWLTGVPTGFGTAQQSFNMLAPSLQGALMNYTQMAGGENPTDFQAGMKMAAPDFQRSAPTTIAGFGQM